MKKTYIAPELETIEAYAQELLAGSLGSLTSEGGSIDLPTGTADDGADAMAPDFDIFE